MPSTTKVVLPSIRLGLFVQIAGCTLFLVIEELWQGLKHGSSSFESMIDVYIAIFIFVIANLVAVFPTVIGSYLLARVLYHFALKGKMPPERAKLLGGLLGFVIGIGFSALGIIMTNGKGGTLEYLLRVFEILIITSASGAWLGKKIAYLVNEHHKTEA